MIMYIHACVHVGIGIVDYMHACMRCMRVCVCACAHVFGQGWFLDFCVAMFVQNLYSPVGSAATSTQFSGNAFVCFVLFRYGRPWQG